MKHGQRTLAGTLCYEALTISVMYSKV